MSSVCVNTWRRWSQVLSRNAQGWDQSWWAHAETQQMQSEHQEMVFYWEVDKELAQVAQKGCGVSIVGDTQTQSWHHPRQQPSVGNHIWAGIMDKVTSRVTTVLLWYCDAALISCQWEREAAHFLGWLPSVRNANGVPAARRSGRDPNKHIEFAVGRSGMLVGSG